MLYNCVSSDFISRSAQGTRSVTLPPLTRPSKWIIHVWGYNFGYNLSSPAITNNVRRDHVGLFGARLRGFPRLARRGDTAAAAAALMRSLHECDECMESPVTALFEGSDFGLRSMISV